jgi:glutamine synthetase
MATIERPTSHDEVRQRALDEQIEFFLAQFVDLNGKPSAKLMPAAAIDDLLTEGAGFAGFAAGPMGQSPASPDMLAIPDPSSYTRLPWQPEVVRFACDVTVEGEEWPYCPRTILRRAVARAATQNVRLRAGVEAEFFLVRRDEHGRIVVDDPLDTAAQPCYDARALARNYEFLKTLSKGVNGLGWGNYANDHEDANGQFESNFGFDDVLVTCDRAIFFRYMVHVLAQQRGKLATFMPKPFSHLTGNGCHFHLSLWQADADVNLFDDPSDERGFGLSETAYHFMAGVLDHADGLSAILAPTVNSYKRIGVGAPDSGATWAPAYAAWGGNNRTQLIRVPGGGRFEHRGVDGSANPYLAATAILAAGMDGIERRLEPGQANTRNLYATSLDEVLASGIRQLPSTLLEASQALERDEVLRDWLGHTGTEHYADYFAGVKAAEFREWHAGVSEWEVERYLTAF